MITFNTDNASNEVVMTLREKQVYPEVTKYLLQLTNDVTTDQDLIVVDDQSQHRDRYQLFTVFTSGLTYTDLGFYHYYAYENPSGVTNPSGLTLLENGKWLNTGTPINPLPLAYQNPTGATLVTYKNPNYDI